MTAGQLLEVEPAFYHVPPFTRTRGGEVADLAALACFAPFPEQRLIVDAAFAVDARGKSAAFEVGIVAARQNIKTGALIQCGLGWLFLFDDLHVVWTAHEWDAVKQAVETFDQLIKGSDWLRRRVRRFTTAERDQEIVTRTGSHMTFKTRTPDGGKALTGDKVVLDEYFAAKASHVGSLIPTMAARSMKGDPQLFMGSSAAREESDLLRDLVARGRAGDDPSQAYIEFCAPPPAVACDLGDSCDHGKRAPGCGCDKPELVRLANPAIGVLIDPGHIAKERRSMPPAEFGRERMGWHDPGREDGPEVPLAEWAVAADRGSEPVSRVALAVVFTSRRDRAAVGLCGRRADGRLHVEVAEYRAGTNWVVPWFAVRQVNAEGRVQYPPLAVAVDRNAFEKTVIGPLAESGVAVMELDSGDVASAFGEFVDALTDRREVAHRDQDDLNLALAAAATRDIGDAGRAWGRRKSRDPRAGPGVEIAPLVAVTNALYAFLVHEPAGEVTEPGVWVI